MDTQIIAIIYATFFMASFIKGVTGLGFAILTLPVVTSFIPLYEAIPLIIIPSFSSNIIIIVQTGRFRQSVKRFWLLYIAAFPGLYIGVHLLSAAGHHISRMALGASAIIYSALILFRVNISVPQSREKYYSVPIGFVNGVVNGLTGTQVMPMLPYLLSLNQDMNGLINAINVGFTLSSIVLLIFLHTFNLFDTDIVIYSVFAVIPVASGIYLGSRMRRMLSEEKFRMAVLILLVLIGSILIINP
jgi:uncharacterized membrane protein YfcA